MKCFLQIVFGKKSKDMPFTIVEEKKRQMDDLIELMKQQAQLYNYILKEPVPVPLRLLYLTQVEYLNSREFILDCLKRNHEERSEMIFKA